MTKIVLGVDEAGVGCMAGDMFVSAVALKEGTKLPGVKDSKKLTSTKREELVDSIFETALWHCTIEASPAEIDQKGLWVMWSRLVVTLVKVGLRRFPDARVILDGCRVPYELQINRAVTAYPKADQNYLAVSAASNLAKHCQEACMEAYNRRYPLFGFSAHKGYCTSDHLARVKEHGTCPIHRKSYKPIKNLLTSSV